VESKADQGRASRGKRFGLVMGMPITEKSLIEERIRDFTIRDPMAFSIVFGQDL
jgi:hypothetical protein